MRSLLKRGRPNGLIKFKPIALQVIPNSWAGTNAASKKVQKIPKKNINSLKMNNKHPNLNPSITNTLWYPDKPSIQISLAHNKPTYNDTNKQYNTP
uniref:Uncharacterized protein n=1 Tax=Strongyloides papillosus TaxID=174720 RepID=A0A0N5BTP0_STREA